MNEDEPEQGFGKLYVLSLVVLMVLSFVAACIASKWI
jgi:flagellar basal body-associated protein FliL